MFYTTVACDKGGYLFSDCTKVIEQLSLGEFVN